MEGCGEALTRAHTDRQIVELAKAALRQIKGDGQL